MGGSGVVTIAALLWLLALRPYAATAVRIKVYDVAEANPDIAREPSLFCTVEMLAAGIGVTTY